MNFRKLFSVLVCFCCIFFISNIGHLFARPKAVLSHRIYDLGDIFEDKVYEKEFYVENIGDEDLKIKINASCGCIKIISPKEEVKIKPLARQLVKFKFEPFGYNGIVKRIISVETNEPSQNKINLEVAANVIVRPKNVLQRFMLFRPGIVILSGLADGINPCAFTVLVFFMSFLAFVGYQKKEMLLVGFSFIFAVFLTYVLLGLGIFEFIKKLSLFETISRVIYLIIAFLSLGLGVLSIYDFWIYKATKDTKKIILQLPGLVKKKIHEVIHSTLDLRKDTQAQKNVFKLVVSAFICGFIVSLFESVCTGQLYLPTIAYIFKTTPLKLKALGLLLLYNLMFIVPLILIFRLSFVGMTSIDFSNIAKKHLSGVKLVMGLIFLLLGAILIIIKG